MGDLSYCADNSNAGLSMAIGSGCTVKPVEHANTYATIARGGTYKELAYVLELKDGSGKVLETWQDVEGKRAIDEQVAYELSSVLSDVAARQLTFGSAASSFKVPGVWTAIKTGTTTTANSSETKDSWLASYSTAVAAVVWNANHDGSKLSRSTNDITRTVMNSFMENVHKNLYREEGKWKPGDEPKRPAGIQELTVNGKTDIWPSWYNTKNSGIIKETVAFNRINKLRAAECTPDNLREEIELTKTVDPVSKTEIWNVPEGYNYEEIDPCSPAISPTISVDHRKVMNDAGEFASSALVVSLKKGTYDLVSYRIIVDSEVKASGAITDTMMTNGITQKLTGSEKSAIVEVTDDAGDIYRQNVTLNWN